MTTKTKFKTNPVARKIREEALERERGTEESVKQITYKSAKLNKNGNAGKRTHSTGVGSAGGTKSFGNAIGSAKGKTTYWSKTGTDVKEFDLDSALNLEKLNGYAKGYQDCEKKYSKYVDICCLVTFLTFMVMVGLLAWIVTH